MFLVGVFEQWQFFCQFSAIGPLFCPFVQHHQLQNTDVQNIFESQNLVQNKNIDVQNRSRCRCFCFGRGSGVSSMFCTSVVHVDDVERMNKKVDRMNKSGRRGDLENIGSRLLVFFTRICSVTMRIFLKLFGFNQRVFPSFVSIFCNTMDVTKSQRVPLLQFRHCDTVKKFHFNFFSGNVLKFAKSPPLFFFIFCNQPFEVSQSPKGPPFTI